MLQQLFSCRWVKSLVPAAYGTPATMAVTPARRSLENINSRYINYVAKIRTRSSCTMWPNYILALSSNVFKLRKRDNNTRSHVVQKNLNLVISMQVDVLQMTARKCTKMYNAQAERFLLLTYFSGDDVRVAVAVA